MKLPSSATPAGTVLAESDELQQGLVAASVRMRRAGVVVLSASFDPGWTATVVGRRQRTEMVAPALVATVGAAAPSACTTRTSDGRGPPAAPAESLDA